VVVLLSTLGGGPDRPSSFVPGSIPLRLYANLCCSYSTCGKTWNSSASVAHFNNSSPGRPDLGVSGPPKIWSWDKKLCMALMKITVSCYRIKLDFWLWAPPPVEKLLPSAGRTLLFRRSVTIFQRGVGGKSREPWLWPWLWTSLKFVTSKPRTRGAPDL